MKKYALIIITVFLALSVLGDELPTAVPWIENLELGGHLINYRYTEPGLISHSGYLFGVFARVPMKLTPNVVGLLDSDLAVGTLDYDGSLCDKFNNCTDYKAKTYDAIFRTVYGFHYIVSEQIQLYSGPGLRYLYDKGIGVGFYTRIGTYFFIPLGIQINFTRFSGLFNLDIEYDFFLSGLMKSKISEADATLSDVNHKQTKGSGSKFSLRYTAMNSKVFWFAGYENWSIGDSNVEPKIINGVDSGNSFIEPKNFTDAVSVGTGYIF